MIRIIAGKYKNRKLKYFNIQSVRPTQARVRKSMFDTLGNIEKQTVLDLFCGIGTIGIEALSRGAKSVDFIDHNINALNVLKKNLNFLDVNKECFSISKNDVMNYLIKEKNKYDLIIADPPYGKFSFIDFIPKVSSILKKGGVFCYESKKENNILDLNLKIKNFGNSQLIFWRKE
jgi:16S rRNA (guanine966-N2)-methyltransferase